MQPKTEYLALWGKNVIFSQGTDLNTITLAAKRFAKTGATIRIYERIIGLYCGVECILKSQLIETIG